MASKTEAKKKVVQVWGYPSYILLHIGYLGLEIQPWLLMWSRSGGKVSCLIVKQGGFRPCY